SEEFSMSWRTLPNFLGKRCRRDSHQSMPRREELFKLPHNSLNVMNKVVEVSHRVNIKLGSHSIDLNSPSFYWVGVLFCAGDDAVSTDKLFITVNDEQLRITPERDPLHCFNNFRHISKSTFRL